MAFSASSPALTIYADTYTLPCDFMTAGVLEVTVCQDTLLPHKSWQQDHCIVCEVLQ